MSLADVPLTVVERRLPLEVRRLIQEADRRIERYQFERPASGFVPSNFSICYPTLHALAEILPTDGLLFCEWGSGFGVVACMAAMLGFEASGIEIERDLVTEARALAEEFDLAVQFAQGSFIPEGSEECLSKESYSWLTTEVISPEDELGLGPAEFDVIFAYPWPDEESTIPRLFDMHAAPGSLLVTYHTDETLRIRRKLERRRRRAR